MHCKHCGNKIDNDSKFCSFCGGLVNPVEQTTSIKPPYQDSGYSHQNISQHAPQKLEDIFGTNISKNIFGFYLIWLLINLILLFSNWNGTSYANKYFWPFNKSDINYFDFTEFFAYTILPLILIIILNIFRKPKAIRDEEFKTKYDHSYKRDFNPTVIGVLLLIVSFITNFMMKELDKYEMKDIKIFIIYSFSFIIRVITSIWLKNAAKKLNRDSSNWAFLGFATPSISLIVFGFMRKLKIIAQYNLQHELHSNQEIQKEVDEVFQDENDDKKLDNILQIVGISILLIGGIIVITILILR
jgi:hypothetical protein